MISLVIPVYNERDSLTRLHQEIVQSAQTHAFDFEILFVDDGSKDDSWTVIRTLAENYPNVHGLRFRRNFGKAAALAAGFASAQGEVVLTLDADLQDDPAEIPNFLLELQNLDVVSGWKKTRHDPWHKVYPSRVFNFLVSWLSGVKLHDHNCGMKAYRAEVVHELRLYGELHRFIPVLAAARGFRVGERVIHHRPRTFGTSKYGWKRFLKGFLDLISVRLTTRYGRRPLHFFGSVAAVAILLGVLGLGTLGLSWLVGFTAPSTLAATDLALMLFALTAFLIGSQLIVGGLVAEMVVANLTRSEETYVIVEHTHDLSLTKTFLPGAPGDL